jgi:hypothetical protein
MDALGNVAIGLLQELSDQKYDRGRSITNLIILRNCCSCDHSRSRILQTAQGYASAKASSTRLT